MDNLQSLKILRVSRKLIQRKVRMYTEEKSAGKDQMNTFRASEGWLEKFVSRNGLPLPCRTTRAQKAPEQITDKVILYISHVRQLK